MVLAAVKENGCIELADKSLRGDKEIVLAALEISSMNLEHVILSDKDQVLSIIKDAPQFLDWEEYLKENFPRKLLRKSLAEDKDIKKAIEQRDAEES